MCLIRWVCCGHLKRFESVTDRPELQRPWRISRADSGKETEIKNFFVLCLNYPQTTFHPVIFARTEIWHNVQCFTSQTFKSFFFSMASVPLWWVKARQYCHYWKLRCVFVYSLLQPNPRVFSCREREPHVLHKTNFIFTLFTGRRGTGSTLMMEKLPQGSSFASLLLHIALNDI